MPNPAEPELDINPIFELLRDHRADNVTATAIDEVESTWREFEKVWDGRWDKEPEDWEHPENRGAQLYDSGHVAVNLRNALWRLSSAKGGHLPWIGQAAHAARDLLAREKRLAAL